MEELLIGFLIASTRARDDTVHLAFLLCTYSSVCVFLRFASTANRLTNENVRVLFFLFFIVFYFFAGEGESGQEQARTSLRQG